MVRGIFWSKICNICLIDFVFVEQNEPFLHTQPCNFMVRGNNFCHLCSATQKDLGIPDPTIHSQAEKKLSTTFTEMHTRTLQLGQLNIQKIC